MADKTPAAYFPTDAVITVLRKGGSVQTITTEVTNFNDGGGSRDTESIAHFGNAFLTIKKPQEQFEISFDVDLNDTTWAEMINFDSAAGDVIAGDAGSTIMVRSEGTQQPYKVKMEWIDSEAPIEVGSTIGSNWGAAFKILYYNAFGTSYEKDNSADEYLKATVSFKVSPTDQAGSGQRIEIECRNLVDIVGSGSYVQWEADADSNFGY